jgi:hypothetical protein
MNRLAILGTVAIVLFSYATARLGEPRSAWLWCDVLKACRGPDG